MKKAYLAPKMHSYGSVSDITGVFGGPSAGDVLLDENGVAVLGAQNSIDACAEAGNKCICSDEGTC